MFSFGLDAGQPARGLRVNVNAEGSITLYAPDSDGFAGIASTRKRQNMADILRLDVKLVPAKLVQVPSKSHPICRSPMLCRLLTTCLILASPGMGAQEPAPEAEDPYARVWERWEQFEAEDHALMARSVQMYVFAGGHGKLRAMHGLLQLDPAPKRLETAEIPRFDADEYAPALKLKSKTASSSSSQWKRLAKQYGLEHLKDPSSIWRWSSGRQSLIPPSEKAQTEKQQLQRMLQGQWPQVDYWTAVLEGQLDHETIRHEAAAYFEHNYRDRDGRFYEGISIADMWNSRREFGISDVEAVAFMREILKDDSVQSPIPGRLHNGIYQMIRDEYADWREYSELRRALAVVFFDPQGEVPLILKSSAPRLDLAWAIVGDDPPTMVKWLRQHKDRSSFLGSVEAAIAQKLAAGVTEEQLRARQGDLPSLLIERTEEGLRREGLLRVRGR